MFPLQLDRTPEGRVSAAARVSTGSFSGDCPTAIRASDSRPVKTETPKARGRAFQMTAEGVRAAPDVMAGMYYFMYLF